MDMKTWVTSDTHFGHANVILHSKRPFQNIQEMNEELIKRWNQTVKPEDTTIHCGDLAWIGSQIKKKDLPKIVNRLNGNKILVRGNHDKLSHNAYYAAGFSFVCDSFTIGRVLFTHLPAPKEFKRWFDLNINGHNHKTQTTEDEPKGFYRNVAVELTDYRPVDFDSLTKGIDLNSSITRGIPLEYRIEQENEG